jgi:protein gp37
MPAKTKIEWADYISNPIKARTVAGPYALNGGHEVVKQGHACVKISEGCAHCWASSFNVRLGTGLEYTKPNLEKVDFFLDDKEIKKMWSFSPLLANKSGTFKNGRSRAVVFPCDMTDLFGDWISDDQIDIVFQAMVNNNNVDWLVLTKRTDRMLAYLQKRRDLGSSFEPVDHIYVGCSIENQKRANERLDAMKSISYIGWKTWTSFEPALEVVNWKGWKFLDGIICGGESGVHARPMSPEAPREARNFCEEHGIPFFFKQWGEWLPLDHLAWVNDEMTFKHRPVEINGTMMVRVGKGLAGRVLDGMEHNISPIAPYIK